VLFLIQKRGRSSCQSAEHPIIPRGGGTKKSFPYMPLKSGYPAAMRRTAYAVRGFTRKLPREGALEKKDHFLERVVSARLRAVLCSQ